MKWQNEIFNADRLSMELNHRKYCLGCLIGEGATAVVYVVHNLEEGQDYACKISHNAAFLKAESELLEQIAHPLFPEWKDYWEVSGVGFLIMEYVRGKSLKEYLVRRGKMSVRETLRIALELADGLGYLHQRKQPAFYRDLKPENIVIAPDGRARLLDLGAAALQEGWKAGTRGYAAPEILGDGEVQPCSDVYTLGIIMKYMLTGYNPCERQFFVMTKERGIPRGLRDIVEWCIRSVPEERIPGMRELISELSLYYNGSRMAILKREAGMVMGKRRAGRLIYEKNIWKSVHKN